MSHHWTDRELDDLMRYLLGTKLTPSDASPELRDAIEAMHGPLRQAPRIYLIVDNTQSKRSRRPHDTTQY